MLHVCKRLTEKRRNGSFELAGIVLVEAFELSVLWWTRQTLEIVQVPHSLHTRTCSMYVIDFAASSRNIVRCM